MSGQQGYSPCPCIFFLDRCLGLKCCSDFRCLSRFSAHMQEQKGQCPMFPQYGNCYSWRDPLISATSFNSYFLSRNYSHVWRQDTWCINLPSVSSKFMHSLHTSQKTYLAFYYFYLKTINPSFLLWRSQQDLLNLLVPSAAIKRCRVSECDQLLHRGPATVLENIQSSETSWEPPMGWCQPPSTAELGDMVLAENSEQRGFQRPSSWPQVFGSN